jgi:hypothetical protein
MKLRYKILPLALTLVAMYIGYIVAHPLDFDFCGKIYQTENYVGCLDDSIREVGFPLLSFALRVAPYQLEYFVLG